MLVDARIAVGFPSHPKTKKLIKRLGHSGAWSLLCLFLWASVNRSDGMLTGMSDEDIELAADWGGEDGALVRELVAVRYLDGPEEARQVHDWEEHNPWAAGSNLRSAKARWNAAKRHHGVSVADRQVPEYASIRNDKAVDDSATSNASSTNIAMQDSFCCNAPSPSPSPSPIPTLGGECARPSPPTGSPPPFFPEYREFIKTERPDLDANVVFSNFLDHYPPAKYTAANWRKWVRREHPGSTHAAGPPKADPDSRLSIETMGLSLGFGQWDQLAERWESYKSRVKKGVPA